ncbi:uncharacterized protein PG986_006434 [Apiospora aurea]|uniref:Uncharacterized protein n=1 Tax=Apiospora aurea TaxID=335848 RepID=A0ABR1QKE5_9PEZI
MRGSSIAIITAASASLASYGVEALQWSVVVAPGQAEILNGTVQRVYEQLRQINPGFAPGEAQAQSRKQRLLQEQTPVNCGTYPLANKGRIQEDIAYLRQVAAAPRNGPGPGNCGQVSCSQGAAIWWCNDNLVPKTLDNWGLVANSAQYILEVCAPAADQVTGQNFESGNWNTIVRGLIAEEEHWPCLWHQDCAGAY